MSNDLLLQTLGSVSCGGFVAWAGRSATERLTRPNPSTSGNLASEMAAVGMNPSVLAVQALIWRGTAAAIALVGWLVFDLPVAALALAAVVYHAFPWWVRGRIAAHRDRIADQVAFVAHALADQVRVGLPLGESLVAVAQVTPPPLRTHLHETANRIRAGLDAPAALEVLKGTVRVGPVIAMATALRVAESFGGKLSDVLDRIGVSAEEAVRLQRKRRTDTSAGRLMIGIMAAFPVGFLLFLQLVHPEIVRPMFATLAGQVVLAVVIGTVYGSMRWSSSILARVG